MAARMTMKQNIVFSRDLWEILEQVHEQLPNQPKNTPVRINFGTSVADIFIPNDDEEIDSQQSALAKLKEVKAISYSQDSAGALVWAEQPYFDKLHEQFKNKAAEEEIKKHFDQAVSLVPDSDQPEDKGALTIKGFKPVVFRGYRYRIVRYFYSHPERKKWQRHQELTELHDQGDLRRAVIAINKIVSDKTEGAISDIIEMEGEEDTRTSAKQYRWEL